MSICTIQQYKDSFQSTDSAICTIQQYKDSFQNNDSANFIVRKKPTNALCGTNCLLPCNDVHNIIRLLTCNLKIRCLIW